jgi:DUF971 family protein
VGEFQAQDIAVDNDRSVVKITWKDGHVTTLPMERLRGWCPCAECQGHGGEMHYVANKVNGVTGAEAVGRYAILFRFNDGHSTGIYRYEHLRKLDPDEESRWGDPLRFMKTV